MNGRLACMRYVIIYIYIYICKLITENFNQKYI
jgi:hypothetical protein